MKRSDIEPDTITGKFISRAKPLGTVTEGMVIKRAREIAIINGRNGNDYTEDDYEQSRTELVGFTGEPAELEEEEAPAARTWLSDAGGKGRKAPVRAAGDEQQFADKLVREGVEEAAHHQMLAGNQMTRGKEDEGVK
jgi:hypothetical protein